MHHEQKKPEPNEKKQAVPNYEWVKPLTYQDIEKAVAHQANAQQVHANAIKAMYGKAPKKNPQNKALATFHQAEDNFDVPDEWKIGFSPDKLGPPMPDFVVPKPPIEDITKLVSVFGNVYPASKETEWEFFDGAGWVFMPKEREAFYSRFYGCCLTGKWFRSGTQANLIDGGIANEFEAKKQGLVQCRLSGAYTAKEDLSVKFRLVSGDWGLASKKCVDSDPTQIMMCDYTHDPFNSGSIFNIFGSEKYQHVSEYAIKKSGGFGACAQCGNHHEKESLKVVAGNYVCSGCEIKALIPMVIHQHNYDGYPKPIYTKEYRLGHTTDDKGLVWSTGKQQVVKETRLFGVEVETEIDMPMAKKHGENRATLASKMLETLGEKFVVIKEDGTLTTNGKYSAGDPGATYAGFEIVSAPADLKAHREGWARLITSPAHKFLRAWDTSTCGLHIHVNRESINFLQQCRIVYFTNHKNNADFIQKVAGRSADRFCRLYEKNLTDGIHQDRVTSPDQPKAEQTARNMARRAAINISNAKTVEWRIFKGTVNPRHIIRNIEFVDAVCDFCLPASRSFKEIENFRFFVKMVNSNRKRWPLLSEWLAKQGFIKIKKPTKKIDPSKLTIDPDRSEESDPVPHNKILKKWKEPEEVEA